MPFDLTKAPTTFQALMNDIVKPYIRCFVLVFFYDILIFSSSWVEHLQHVRTVLQQMRAHHLFAKCFFSLHEAAYHGEGGGSGGLVVTSHYMRLA